MGKLSPKREGKITGSMVGAAIGVNPNCSRQKAYRLIKKIEIFEGNQFTDWGNDHEKDAILSFEAITGEIVENSHDEVFLERDNLGITPDGNTSTHYIEAKCPFSLKIPDEVPPHYMAQAQMGMELADLSKCYFIYWTPEKTRIFEIERSKAYWDEITPLIEDFNECLKTDTPPKRAKKPIIKSKIKQEIIHG